MHYFFQTLAVAAFLLLWTTSQAQQNHPHAQCGLSLDDAHHVKNRMLDNRRSAASLRQAFDNSRSANSTVYIPIQFHIVTKSDGTGGESVQDIFDNLCKLNQDFAFINVEFYLAGPIQYIHQDLLYTNDFNGMANYFMGQYMQSNAVNIFVGNLIQSGTAGTTLAYYSPSLDAIYAIKSAVDGQSWTLTHEMGHFFSLPHTFSGWEGQNYSTVLSSTTGRTPTFLTNGAEVEKIIRSGGSENCQTAGDGFCDTDPNYLFGFYGGQFNDPQTGHCKHNSSAVDPNGWLFRPDMLNAEIEQFKMLEGSSDYTEVSMRNPFTQPMVYKTLVENKAFYTPTGGSDIPLWQGMIGEDDSNDFSILSNSIENIVGTGPYRLPMGYFNMGGYRIQHNYTASVSGITIAAAPAEYRVVKGTSPFYVTTIPSMDLTNTTSTTIPAGTIITVEEVMHHASSGVAGSETWTITVNTSIPASSTISLPLLDLIQNKATLAGGDFRIEQEAPYQNVTWTTDENIMSYYGNGCISQFSAEQGNAMQLDIASRGLATLYPAPSSIQITEQGQGIAPAVGSVTACANVGFTWNAVNGATFYHVHIYEVDIFGNPLFNGEAYDFISTTTSYNKSLSQNKRYAWKVQPLNDISFCDANTISDAILFETGMCTSIDPLETILDVVKIYPNPIGQNQQITLEIEVAQNGTAQISMFNAVGQTVLTSLTLELQEGTNLHQINTNSLSEGLYLIQVETEKGSSSHKLVVGN